MGHSHKKKGARNPAGNKALLNAQVAVARHMASRSGAEASGSAAAATAATAVSSGSWLTKLQSADPADREDGCIDLSNLSRAPSNLPALVASGAPQYIAAALNDDEMHVRTAAAAAARNIMLQLSVHKADESAPDVGASITEEFCANVAGRLAAAFQQLVASDSHMLQSNGQPLTEAHLKVLAASPEEAAAAAAAAAPSMDENGDIVLPASGDGEGATAAAAAVEAFETLRDAAFANVDEFIQLIGVVADCSEAATTYFSDLAKCSVLPILASAIEVGLDPTFAATLNRSRGMELFVASNVAEAVQIASAAAETLHIIARDNAALASFLSTGLSAAQQQLLNELTTAAPATPTMLLISLQLASALLSTAPSIANANRAAAVVLRAFDTLPFAEWRRVLPLLTEGCEVAEEERKASVKETLDRLRALQLASDIFGEMIAVVCEAHSEEEDDEAAFARNPHAGVISYALVGQLVTIVTDILSPHEEVLQKALREVTDNVEVSAVQHAFASVEVGIFGVVTSLLLLFPIDAMGSTDGLWRASVSALAARHELVAEFIGCPEGPHPSMAQLILQIESLTEMCWTILRKDGAATGPRQIALQPADLDLFTRVAWEGYVSTDTVVFVVSVVGCIGTRLRTAQTHTACARFCTAVIAHALAGAGTEAAGAANIDIAVEAANVTIDLFSDEDFDASVYIPLGVHSKLKSLVAPLQKHVASFGKKRSPKKSHFIEVRDNLVAFLEYKEQHGCH